jgi:hypothetical protein
MITTGVQLSTFITSLNAEATIDPTLLTVLVDNAKAVLEEERPWMVLRKTDTTKTVTSNNTWQTAIDLSTISDFSKFYMNDDGVVIKLFDNNNQIQYYLLKPFDKRLEYKDASNTCVFDENSKTLYLNGVVSFNGNLHIPYISTSPAIDLTSTSAIWTVFPPRFIAILGYYAIGIYKGAIDYDSINRQMLPSNREVLNSLKNAMCEWDNDKQLASIQSNDPANFYDTGYRTGAINRYEE